MKTGSAHKFTGRGLTFGQQQQQEILFRKAQRFEESCVRLLLDRLDLGHMKKRMIERCEAEWGQPMLAFAVFNEMIEDFPFYLGSWSPPEEVHRDTRATEPNRFKQMHKVPFVVEYRHFYNRASRLAAPGKNVALVFPRKGFRHGLVILVIHDDDRERFWRAGTAWVTKLTKGNMYTQPFSALVDGIVEHRKRHT